jgi:hypothetical protein
MRKAVDLYGVKNNAVNFVRIYDPECPFLLLAVVTLLFLSRPTETT